MSRFEIEYNTENGGVNSLINTEDKYRMNWIEGRAVWGTIKDAALKSVSVGNGAMKAVFVHKKLEITAIRSIEDDKYKERYIFKNIKDVPVFIKRGEIGIYTTFNDSYESADICMTNRCNTHIWCGRNTTWINALKMGVSDINLGLVLTKGSIDTYSAEREITSNDRGDFLLHPEAFSLESGEEYEVAWELFFHSGDDFEDKLSEYDIILPRAEHYTIYENEVIKIKLNKPADIELEGVILKENTAALEYMPKRDGEHKFTVKSGDYTTYINIMVVPELSELLKKRAEYIIKNQQYHKTGSALDGAYLIYDIKEHYQYFDDDWSDHNASRERIGMGLLLAEYVKQTGDKTAYESLMKFKSFVFREFVDAQTGNVYDTIKKNPERLRLYNASWVIMFLIELYQIDKEKEYLTVMVRIIKNYYAQGGAEFYPNGWFPYETVEVLREADMNEEADGLVALYKTHVDNMVKIGTNYPPHEVNYEQTIVTPGATFISQFVRISGENDYIGDAKKQIEVLARFNGHQPDYHMYETAIRHWDDYWFGKSRLYGDTFPHYWSSLSGLAFLNYYKISGDEVYLKKAEDNIRNCLCLFFKDGSASCAYVYPYSVNGQKGEFFDEWANDQDFALYYAVKYL